MGALARTGAAGLLLLLAGSCAFQKLAEDLEAIDQLATVKLHVELSSESSPIVVVLLDADTKEVASLVVVHGARPTTMRCLPGEYYLAAFEDLNENLSYEEGEPAALFGEPEALLLRAGEVTEELAIQLGDPSIPPSDFAFAVGRQAKQANLDFTPTGVDRIISLDDERFSPTNARLGAWEPWEFVQKDLYGMYLLETYDPGRVPVVFVHGLGGNPREFVDLIESLDTTRFQVWVFFYPSALRLEGLGTFFFESLDLLVTKYDPAEIAIVAHSMGGLVARQAVKAYADLEERNYWRLFISIAAPFGGVSSARSGVRFAPTVKPSWYDLSPGSSFLEGLFSPPLPEQITAYLIFGYGEGSGDGTVPIQSALRMDAQREARSVYGVNAGHVAILSRPETLTCVRDMLEQAFPQP